MKLFLSVLVLAISGAIAFGEEKKVDSKRASNTVVLSESGVKNLRIETVEIEESDFEEIVFALGRIEAIPSKIAAVSSRVSGRIMELKAIPGDQVQAGQEVARLESRLPGDPPPSITLKSPLTGLVTKVEARLGD